MLVPRFVHGLANDVKKESLRRIRLLKKKGASWSEAMADELEDAASLPGLIVIDGPTALMSAAPHVHVYAPLYWAIRALPAWSDPRTEEGRALCEQRARVLFLDAVKAPWGVLGMSGNLDWVRAEAHQWPYVQAVARQWDTVEALGPRITSGRKQVLPFWQHLSAPYYAACALGLSTAEAERLMPRGFHALYRRLLEVRAAEGRPLMEDTP